MGKLAERQFHLEISRPRRFDEPILGPGSRPHSKREATLYSRHGVPSEHRNLRTRPKEDDPASYWAAAIFLLRSSHRKSANSGDESEDSLQQRDHSTWTVDEAEGEGRTLSHFCSPTDQIQAVRRADIISILNIITCAVSQLSEDVKRFIFWLDRSPFDEQDKYMEIRKTTTELIWTIVRTTNSIPRELFESGPDIIKAWPHLASK